MGRLVAQADSLIPVVVLAFEVVHDAQQVLGDADVFAFIDPLLEDQDRECIANVIPFRDGHPLMPPILKLISLIVCVHSLK